MRWKLFSFLVFCLSIGLNSCRAEVQSEDPRINRFQTLIKQKGPSILLSTEEYKELVLKNKRNYNVALIITAGAGYRCTQCNDVLDVFQRLAHEYQSLGKMDPIQPEGKFPTFFVYLDISNDKSLIDMHGLTAVPIIAFVAPSNIFKRSTSRTPPIPFPEGVQLTQAAKNLGLRELVVEFINGKSGEPHIVIRKTTSEIVTSAVFFLALIGTICIIGYKFLLLIREHPTLMAVGALIVQILATSGLCWSVIHGFQWVGFDRQTGATLWFSPNRRFQFAAEGLIMSSCIAFSGMSLFAAGYIMKHNTLKIKIVSYSASLVLAACGLFLHSMVMKANTAKQGFGSGSFYPPDHYVKGPLHNDRGNSL